MSASLEMVQSAFSHAYPVKCENNKVFHYTALKKYTKNILTKEDELYLYEYVLLPKNIVLPLKLIKK